MTLTHWIRDPAARRGLLGGLIGAAALAFGLVACGGGSSDAASVGTSSAGAGTAYTQGTLSGFGSIIVNGVRFDESAAAVTDDAGLPQNASALQLGMRLEVESDAVSGNAAKAMAVHFGSLVLGPVAAIDTNAQSATVLGQTVDIRTDTVFDSTLAGGLSALNVGDVIAVHGMPDAATGHLIATRVESAAGAAAYKLRGTVSSLDIAAKTFAIGGAVIDYAGIAANEVPATLANGAPMRVLLSTTPNALGQWVATHLGQGPVPRPPEKAAALVRGTITAFTSSSAFSVNGLSVDASGASFPDGTAGLALGVAVEVAGTVTNGVLVASAVRLESAHAGDGSHKFELIGAITAIDTAAKTFVLRKTTVMYAGSPTYVNGTEADLAVGRKVDVKGVVGAGGGDAVPVDSGQGAMHGPMPGPGPNPHGDHAMIQAVTITFQ